MFGVRYETTKTKAHCLKSELNNLGAHSNRFYWGLMRETLFNMVVKNTKHLVDFISYSIYSIPHIPQS